MSGGPAFPTERALPEQRSGMTLRDYFAAKAMQALLSNPECPLGPLSQVPSAAYEMADAMLEARDYEHPR
jgi:hypothetical protein